ncbi:hypothetical protein MJA45_03120 [Paenibacillus aurantius]|uniref:Uncharacterized protein n=1 Tax=Paenibacillus aurantius TaxID=2918900 RepID=A0AA96LF56_9BACL|nr:hypothetical protein [Paenibacillus aurantius]WNQ12068.1 hypothetical protein MJA45_03120 [Paenibacillus aurantius]
MLLQLHEIFMGKVRGKTPVSRKTMKIIVDSIIEQIHAHYFKTKPNGHANIRATINSNLESFNEKEDKNVLRSLNAILRVYGSVFSKSYSDHDTDYEEFLKNELKAFSKALTEHTLFKDDVNAKKIRELWPHE